MSIRQNPGGRNGVFFQLYHLKLATEIKTTISETTFKNISAYIPAIKVLINICVTFYQFVYLAILKQ